MADAPKSDLVMKFVLKAPGSGSPGQPGGPVYAEAVIDVVKSDEFMKGFTPADYQYYSNFFEVQTFDFSIAVKPEDESTGPGAAATQGMPTVGPPAAAKDQYSRWRSAKEGEYEKIFYPIDFETFTFTRIIDSASPIFFQACCTQQTFYSATLVKCVASVRSNDQVRMALGYLRFDFKDVLLTGFSWSDGELVTETCTFICKSMKIRYKAQSADSALKAAIEIDWDQQRDG
jgi:type VI protein secretion system component Hcp